MAKVITISVMILAYSINNGIVWIKLYAMKTTRDWEWSRYNLFVAMTGGMVFIVATGDVIYHG